MTASCDECGNEFKNEHGVKIHKSNTHDKRPAPAPCKKPAAAYVPPIIRYEVQAGIEHAESYFRRAEQADGENERRIWNRMGRAEMRSLSKRVKRPSRQNIDQDGGGK